MGPERLKKTMIQVMSSIESSSRSHALTDSLTTVLQAPLRSFLCQKGTIKSMTSSLDRNSQTPSDASIMNLSSSFVMNSLISEFEKHKKDKKLAVSRSLKKIFHHEALTW